MSARTAPSPRPRSRPGRASHRSGVRAAALAGALTAALALAACGSADDGAPATPAASPAASSTPPAETTATAPTTGITRDPAAPVPSTAFFDGITEAWTIPGTPAGQDTAGSISADRSMIAMRAEADDQVQVFELAATEAAPVWEGQCPTAHWWAGRLVCGGDVVDPRSGESTTLPAGEYAGSNAETLVLRDGETWVAYDTALAEVWRADAAGDGMVYGFPDLPVAMAVDMTTFAFSTVDLRTGAVTPTTMTVLAADGYLEAEGPEGPLVARDFSGAELGELPLNAPECIPPYGERQVLADRLTCPGGYDGDPAALSGFLLRAEGAPVALEFVDEASFAVDGEVFDVGDRGFVMAWMFGSEGHFLVRYDAGFGLHRTGTPGPVLEIAADDLLVAAPDLLVAFGAGGATVLTPAG